MEKARVLIVEDEAIVQMDLQTRVERLGYTVVAVASRGEEAVAKATELGPDLVLMDINLGSGISGWEAAQQIRAKQKVAVLYVTAFGGEFSQTGHVDEATPFLSKPFRTAELEAAIAKALQHIRSEKCDPPNSRT